MDKNITMVFIAIIAEVVCHWFLLHFNGHVRFCGATGLVSWPVMNCGRKKGLGSKATQLVLNLVPYLHLSTWQMLNWEDLAGGHLTT
jgi:hypothetical protein